MQSLYLGHCSTTTIFLGIYGGARQFGGVPIRGDVHAQGGGLPFGHVVSVGGGLLDSHGGALPFGQSGWRYPGPGKFDDTGLLPDAALELSIFAPLFTGI